MPALKQQIANLLGARVFPFRNEGELVRWCVVHGLHYLQGIASTPIPSVLAQVEVVMELCRREQFMAEFQNTMRKVSESANLFLSMGESGEARRLLLTIRHELEAMPEGYWRQKYLGEFEHQHGAFLRSGPRPSLSPRLAEPDDDEED